MIHLQNMAILWQFFFLDSQDTPLVIGPLSTNQNGDNIRKEYILAAQWINLEFFQIFGKDFPKYSENKEDLLKSSNHFSVYLGLFVNLTSSQTLRRIKNKKLFTGKSLFLLPMDINLAQVMQKMSLEEDKPVDLTEDDDVNTVIQSARSLIGRLLNPECQNMARMLKIMPRIWKIYERVKGIALSKESFQFIFELETDLQTVMKHGLWTFDDWGMVMDRWQEFPPPKFLQTAPIWIRIHKIPVNYFSLKTMDAIADAVGHVKTIEYDPDKPYLLEYVRVLVIVDLQNPLRDTKSVNLPKGLSAMVDIEYERVRKKCFKCL